MAKLDFQDIFIEEINGENIIYFSCHLDNPSLMVDDVFQYFFSEEAVYQHYKWLNDSPFSPDPKNYSFVYRYLKLFLDKEIEESFNYEDYENEAVDAFKEDLTFFEKHNIRKDKVGKLGEYLLSIILEKHFKYTCIIPKLTLSTSRNMSIYGIDTLHYSKEDDCILFGESKYTTSLDNGIIMLKNSLNKYDDLIANDIELIFTQEKLASLNLPNEPFKEAIEMYVDVPTFIEKANITRIMIPTFIVHGEDLDKETIFEKLNKLPKKDKLGLETKYLIMSMPLKDVKAFTESLILKIKDKANEYRKRI